MQTSCGIANQNIPFQFVFQVISEDTPVCGHQTKCHLNSDTKLREVKVENSFVLIEFFSSRIGTQKLNTQWVSIVSVDKLLYVILRIDPFV